MEAMLTIQETIGANIAPITPVREVSAGLFNEFITWIAPTAQQRKTARTYAANLRSFLAWMRYSGTQRPQRGDVIAFVDYLTEEHDGVELDPESPTGWKYRTDAAGKRVRVKCKANTVNAYLRSVKAFFEWAQAAGYYPNIAANIKAPKIRRAAHSKDALTASEVLTVESSIDRSSEAGKRLYAMYLLATNAGLRTVEISRANVKDFETRNGQSTLNVWGKGHSEADTKKALAPEVADAIRDYLNARSDKPTGSSPLFVATGNRSGGQRIATTTISTFLKRALQGAGFDSERLTAHSLRHTAGTNVMEISGGNLYSAQKYMRHANPATTEIYLHAATEKADADTAQRLYNHYHGKDDAGSARAQLEAVVDGMTPQQVEQLLAIAKGMRGI